MEKKLIPWSKLIGMTIYVANYIILRNHFRIVDDISFFSLKMKKKNTLVE